MHNPSTDTTGLPIEAVIEPVRAALAAGRNVVLQASTGAGKSTTLPLALLESAWLDGQRIVLLEPRRVAVRAIASHLAARLGESVGQRVGYQIRNERRISAETRLEIVTEGILTRRLQSDPELSGVGLILFDEFHERALQADLSLMLALDVQRTLRPDLRLLVMSATIDSLALAQWMGDSTRIDCPGRSWPVDIRYLGDSDAPLPVQISRAVTEALSLESSGDILVFLPGKSEIDRSLKATRVALADRPCIQTLALHGSLPLKAQQHALRPDSEGRRRIIFSTNLAETSLTIDGVVCVIDSGLERQQVIDPVSRMSRLETLRISRASADQRAGRAGRTQAGHCLRLWSEARHQRLLAYQPEQIRTADLSALVLELAAWGWPDPGSLDWLTAPPTAHVHSATDFLHQLGLIDAQGQLSPTGQQASTLGLAPREAAIVLSARSTEWHRLACDLVALLSDRDVLMTGQGANLQTRLDALLASRESMRQAADRWPIQRAAMTAAIATSDRLLKRTRSGQAESDHELPPVNGSLGMLLLKGYPDRLAQRTAQGRYRLANGRAVRLDEDDPLCNAPWLVVTDCDGRRQDGRIWLAAAIDAAQLQAALADQIKVVDSVSLDQDTRRLSVIRETRYQAIVLERRALPSLTAEQFQGCLESLLAEHGLCIIPLPARCQAWLARAQWLGEQRNDFPCISAERLVETAADWLLPWLGNARSLQDLAKLPLKSLLESTLSSEQQRQLSHQAPARFTLPSGRELNIHYDADQGPTVSVQLQEVFGLLDSPRLAGGQVPLRFELLSPARRPIQITSDLKHFWESSYHQVAREMRGRYPRHRWPEKPLEAAPGASIKPRPGK